MCVVLQAKEFDTKRDVFNWVIMNDVIVFLLKENNKEFNDKAYEIIKRPNVRNYSDDNIDAYIED